MSVLPSELPLQPVHDALDTSLKDIFSDADGAPSFLPVGKDPQDSNWSACTLFFIISEGFPVVE